MILGIFFIILLIIAIPIALAFIPATIAEKKGYSFGGFLVLGIFFFLVALIVVLCLDDKNAQMNQMQNAGYGAGGGGSPSIADELQKLSNLYQQRAISEEEYNRLKASLIYGTNRSRTKKCSFCGGSVPDSAQYCKNCGAKL